MTPAKTLAVRTMCAAAMVVVCAFAARGRADRRVVRVAVGDVDGVGLEEAMRTELERSPDLQVVTARNAELVLRGTVVEHRLRVMHGGEVEVRCEVSVVVADARGGSIRAMLRGRAGARGGDDSASLRENALRAAVRGALRPLASTGLMLAGGAASSWHAR